MLWMLFKKYYNSEARNCNMGRYINDDIVIYDASESSNIIGDRTDPIL